MMRIWSWSNQLDIYSRLNAEAWTCARAGLEEISSSVNNNLKNHGYYGCLVLVMVMYGWQCSGWHLSLCNSWCRLSGVGQHESWVLMWVLLSLHARLQPLVEQSAGPGPGIRWGVGALVQWLESLRWRSVGGHLHRDQLSRHQFKLFKSINKYFGFIIKLFTRRTFCMTYTTYWMEVLTSTNVLNMFLYCFLVGLGSGGECWFQFNYP